MGILFAFYILLNWQTRRLPGQGFARCSWIPFSQIYVVFFSWGSPEMESVLLVPQCHWTRCTSFTYAGLKNRFVWYLCETKAASGTCPIGEYTPSREVLWMLWSSQKLLIHSMLDLKNILVCLKNGNMKCTALENTVLAQFYAWKGSLPSFLGAAELYKFYWMDCAQVQAISNPRPALYIQAAVVMGSVRGMGGQASWKTWNFSPSISMTFAGINRLCWKVWIVIWVAPWSKLDKG